LPVDLSSLDAEGLIRWLFDRPIAKEDESPYLNPCFEVSSPGIFVERLTSLFRNFAPVAGRFSREQIDQGLWGIFGGAGVQAAEYLMAPAIPVETRLAFIESMYSVFADVASHLQPPFVENAYYMWFDIVCKGFWHEVEHPAASFKPPETEAEARELLEWMESLVNSNLDAPLQGSPEEQGRRADAARAEEARRHYAHALTPEQQTIQNALLDVLVRILRLPHLPTQSAALHGLGHLHHPAVPKIVQEYIDLHKDDWSSDAFEYLEACRDGTVL
jgi:hypothetical protein